MLQFYIINVNKVNAFTRKRNITRKLGQEAEVFLVSKDSDNNSEKSVLEQVVDLVGPETNPEDNKEGTLRRHMSASGSPGYFKNGFHRPKTPEELVQNLEVFGLIEEAKGI